MACNLGSKGYAGRWQAVVSLAMFIGFRFPGEPVHMYLTCIYVDMKFMSQINDHHHQALLWNSWCWQLAKNPRFPGRQANFAQSYMSDLKPRSLHVGTRRVCFKAPRNYSVEMFYLPLYSLLRHRFEWTLSWHVTYLHSTSKCISNFFLSTLSPYCTLCYNTVVPDMYPCNQSRGSQSPTIYICPKHLCT